ncbi:MAG TPA: MMPL family transporter [Solirubrobacteraceae bacterium]|jgi:RND superfamily putative drug exporter|nr:MMPL family transporter [Solirubrobacteraceae bacterium]
MRALARWTTTHRKYVVIGWVLVLIAINALAQSAGTSYSNNFTLPKSDSQRASDLLKQSFPAQAGDRDTIVFKVAHGNVREAAVRVRMSALFARVARLPHIAGVISPYSAAGQAISRNGRIAFASVIFDKKVNELNKSEGQRVVEAAAAARAPGLQIELGGQAIEQTQQEGFGLTTAVGLMAAIVVLLITFGSLIAMGLPIVTALFGLGTGLGLIALFTHVVDTPDFSSELAAMIGLGVGIDYALFIVTRFREAYATPGPTHGDVRESVVQSMDTAGRAVLFAGCTVVIALLGMMLLGVDFLYGVAISASIGVLLVMLGSLTLLPALLTFAGGRLVRPGRRARKRGEHARAAHGTIWLRWSHFVQAHSPAIALLATVAMLLIAAPAIALRLGSSDAGNDPVGFTTYKAYRLLAEGFGEGFSGPLLVVAKVPKVQRATTGATPGSSGSPSSSSSSATRQQREAVPGAGARDLAALRAALAQTPGVVSVTPPRLSPSGEVATLSVYPSSSPQAYATTQLVERLRNQTIPPVATKTGASVYVGGITAGSIDFARVLGHKLPLFIGVVVLLSALLLMVVFRSLVIPLQAAAMNLLSIGASLGVIVVVFQWGWIDGLLGIRAGPIESFIPVMLFAIVFGLSMDYEVFLISRIHEQWTRNGDARRAVGEGLALTGRVVTAAAAIMICVFLSFMLGENRVIKEFGLSLASAVFLDAVIVRCLLLPAVLDLLGERTWRIPAWLDKALPKINIEGSLPDLSPADEAELERISSPGQPVGAGSSSGGAD